MKKILLSIIYLPACIFSIRAQALYGTTFNGGNDEGGTINKLIIATNDLIAPKSFESFAANPYYSNLIQSANGKLYGMTTYGGGGGFGAIFSYDPGSSTYTKLMDFDNTNGAYPFGSLIQGNDGKLYGMTTNGGSSDYGVIFSFDPYSSAYSMLRDFDSSNGGHPYGGLLQANDGKLYGTTINGGSGNYGVIFSFDLSSSTYTMLKDFDNTNGANPVGSLMQAGNGKLYGMTAKGGSNGFGVIFSFDPSSSGYIKQFDFDYTNGEYPFSGLIQASDEKLYGMTTYGGTAGAGVIFSFDLSSSTCTKLLDFSETNGTFPFGSLIQASDGKLYGMTDNGGITNNGVIFSFDLSSSTYAKLLDFDGTNGRDPGGSLVQAANGKLYGLGTYGGTSNTGVIFSLDPSSSAFSKLKDFGSNEGGSNVSASLTQAGDGMLFGMTNGGGSYGRGVIFSFNSSDSIYKKLKDFDYADGANPFGGLLLASDSKLYGMTTSGGTYHLGGSAVGVIFSFDPLSSTFKKLLDFDNYNNSTGGYPYGSLIQARDGKLYGMTSEGGGSDRGSDGPGVIFSFDPSSSAYTKLNVFDNINGGNPYGSLYEASNGILYGMTTYGGSGDYGVIFSYNPVTSTYVKLKDFDGINGANPFGSLIQGDNGKLYGMTTYGGSSSLGVIFSFDPATSTYLKLNDFDSTNGGNPFGNLMQAGDGKLYGMTYQGGTNGMGVIFSFDPATSTYARLIDYDGTNGSRPYYGSAFIELPESGPLPVTLISFTGKNNGNSNQLSWKVENEEQLNFYDLQRSIDGQDYSAISRIKASGKNSYTYTDPLALESSIYYYRLKSVDNDGHFKYSVVIKIRTGIHAFAAVFPNPFKDKIVLNIESAISDKTTIIITDGSGRTLYKENKVLSPGTNVIEINGTARLSKGAYQLTIIASDQALTIKIVKAD